MSINSEIHTADDAEDDTNHDSIDTIRDEQKSLIPDSSNVIRGDSNSRKTSTPLIPDEKQNENVNFLKCIEPVPSEPLATISGSPKSNSPKKRPWQRSLNSSTA